MRLDLWAVTFLAVVVADAAFAVGGEVEVVEAVAGASAGRSFWVALSSFLQGLPFLVFADPFPFRQKILQGARHQGTHQLYELS